MPRVAFTVVQLTDPHIGATWSDDATAALASAVDAARNLLPGPPDAVVVTGDVANTPVDSEYEQARALLDRLDAPVYVVAGNHDDRDQLRRHFEIPDTGGEQLCYAVGLGPLRLVALDTKHAGSDAGRLDPAQLAWLDDQLAAAQATPTLIVMHHPPLVTGLPAMDEIGIPEQERAAIGKILAHHRQVQAVVCGHLHRTVIGRLGAATVLALPSTDVQLALDLEAKDLRFVAEPPCFAVHLFAGASIVSHIQPVRSS
jgi:3',5'-cyclic AMP phosphodiesterase CpdA